MQVGLLSVPDPTKEHQELVACDAERVGVEAGAGVDPLALLDQGEEGALRQVLRLGPCLAAEEAVDAKEVAAKEGIPGFAIAGLPSVE